MYVCMYCKSVVCMYAKLVVPNALLWLSPPDAKFEVTVSRDTWWIQSSTFFEPFLSNKLQNSCHVLRTRYRSRPRSTSRGSGTTCRSGFKSSTSRRWSLSRTRSPRPRAREVICWRPSACTRQRSTRPRTATPATRTWNSCGRREYTLHCFFFLLQRMFWACDARWVKKKICQTGRQSTMVFLHSRPITYN